MQKCRAGKITVWAISNEKALTVKFFKYLRISRIHKDNILNTDLSQKNESQGYYVNLFKYNIMQF